MRLKNIYCWFNIIGLLALWLWLTPTLVVAQEPSADEPPRFDPRFGVVDSFVNTTEANAAGVGWTRIFFRWDVVQPAGPSDWKPTNVPDTFIDAEVGAGREIAAVLIGTPTWATDSGVSTALPPVEFWGDFVFKIATQYQGRIKHWIIWNQPDITDPASPNHTWDGTEEDYYVFLKEAYLKIKAVDPTMQVHLAGLTYTWDRDQGNRQYLERLLDIILTDPEAATNNFYFDAVSYHLYYDPQEIFNILGAIRRTLDERGLNNKTIWLNETNAPPSEDFLEPPSIPPPVSITLDEQSAFVIQVFALALAGGAERIAINKMRNQPDALVLNGLLRSDDSRRPAFNALQVVTRHFAGTQRATFEQIGSVKVVTLDRGGQTTTVVWNTTTAGVNFSLPIIAGQALLVDEQGNEQSITSAGGSYTFDLPGAVCSNGGNCFIGGTPRLVIEAGAPAQRAALTAPVVVSTATPPSETIPDAAPTDAPTAVPPPPTLTPTTIALDAAAPSPTDTQQAETIIDFAPPPDGERGDSSASAALADPGLDQPEGEPKATPSTVTTAEVIAPITFGSVMSPRRILLLFVIGVVVFTITYGVQVVIWYRLKR